MRVDLVSIVPVSHLDLMLQGQYLNDIASILTSPYSIFQIKNRQTLSLKKNVLANYLGQGWSALMGIAFIPLIIKYLGAEAYGLIGVFAMLQVWFALLDMGMTPTLNREMARYTAGAHTSQSIRDLLRSLEVICFVTALLIGSVIWLASDWLATHWLRSEKLPVADVTQAILIMGFVVSLRFIEGLYRGALVGYQKQVWLNVVGAVLATLRWGGVVCVLMWVTPSIEAFFLWQGIMSVVTILIFILVLYGSLPTHTQSAKFSWFQLKGVWLFARGMMAQTLLTLLLTQGDKIILSRLLSLEMFGYYTLAGTFAGVLIQLISPITLAYFPRFTELVTRGDTTALIKTYHQGAQLVTILIVPAALMLIFFGETIILLWGGSAALTHNVAPLLALLAVGTMLNGLMHIPYMLTLAYGWPGFFVRVNLVAVTVLVPAIFWATPRYGAIGAGWIWVILNLGYILISSCIMHQRLLKTEMWRWYGNDIFQPIAGATLTATIFGLLHPHFSSNLIELLWILMSGLCTVAVSVLCTSGIRTRLINFAQRRFDSESQQFN